MVPVVACSLVVIILVPTTREFEYFMQFLWDSCDNGTKSGAYLSALLIPLLAQPVADRDGAVHGGKSQKKVTLFSSTSRGGGGSNRPVV